MLLGCVVKTPAEVDRVARLPLDYLELKGDLLCTGQNSLRDLAGQLAGTGLPVEAMTSPLPRRFQCRVVGEDADPLRALTVFREMCGKAAALGVRTIVLGSGQARSVPPGFSRDEAMRQFTDFVAAAVPVCAERGMLLTLEHLNRSETNLVNSCRQAREVVADLRLSGLRIAVDCYHIVTEGLELAAEVNAAAGLIGHAHTSSIPRGGNDLHLDVQEEFLARLRSAGYNGRLSVEDDFSESGCDASRAVSAFRQLLHSLPAGA